MGDLVKEIRHGEESATWACLQRRGIGVYHLRRMRHNDMIAREVAKALRAPIVRPFPLSPISGCRRLSDFCQDHTCDLLIREQWDEYGQTRLPSPSLLKRVCLVEFGEYISPHLARVWMLENGIKPAGIGVVAVFACQGFRKTNYGVIGPATRSKPEDDDKRSVPGYRRSIAGRKPEVDRFDLDRLLDCGEWHYLGITEEAKTEA